MKEFERMNLNEMMKVRAFLVERLEGCRAMRRKARMLMILWFWHPPKFRRCKAIWRDAKQAELLYQSGIDVLNGHEGMQFSPIK